MICPFCRSRLLRMEGNIFTSYSCRSKSCFMDDVSSYTISYFNYPTRLNARSFRLDKYYIQINYDQNWTTVSKIEVCVLFGSITVQRALELDFKNTDKLLEKVKTLILFS